MNTNTNTPAAKALNTNASEFTPKLGRINPINLSPDPSNTTPVEKMTPKTRARRESLLTFQWPSSLVSTIPFNNNKSLFTDKQKVLIKLLCQAGQSHIFDNWDNLGKNDDKKRKFALQLEHMNNTYHGGLIKYIDMSKKLLLDSSNGVNPLDGWVPEVPVGCNLEPGEFTIDDVM